MSLERLAELALTLWLLLSIATVLLYMWHIRRELRE